MSIISSRAAGIDSNRPASRRASRADKSATPRVSICLPTCNRPQLLVECIDSCLAQSDDDLEILIGDDSKDLRTAQIVGARYANEPRVRYVMNQPPLGQAANVARLIERARGDRILLIHDDDLLTTDCVEKLGALWDQHPQLDAAFGKQYEADQAGVVDRDASERLNRAFRRTRAVAGLQALPGRTGLVQMFPNNGWMAKAELVKRIGYPDTHGVCCDFVFGTLLCLAAREVYYLDDYVSVYRKTATSISQSTRGTSSAAPLSAYEFVRSLSLPPALEPARRLALRRLAPIVVAAHARHRRPLAGLRIALAHLPAYRYGFSLRFACHLGRLARAAFAVQRQAVMEAAPTVAVEAGGVGGVADRSELI